MIPVQRQVRGSPFIAKSNFASFNGISSLLMMDCLSPSKLRLSSWLPDTTGPTNAIYTSIVRDTLSKGDTVKAIHGQRKDRVLGDGSGLRALRLGLVNHRPRPLGWENAGSPVAAGRQGSFEEHRAGSRGKRTKYPPRRKSTDKVTHFSTFLVYSQTRGVRIPAWSRNNGHESSRGRRDQAKGIRPSRTRGERRKCNFRRYMRWNFSRKRPESQTWTQTRFS